MTNEEKNQYYEDDLNEDDLWDTDLDDETYLENEGAAPISKYNDLLKQLTNFAPYLKETLNNWLGLRWNQEQEKYVKDKNIKPIMNIEGATWCVGVLKTYARDNNIITDIGRSEYVGLMEDIIDLVFLNIGTRAEEFGIKNNGDILRVSNEMLHCASLVLMGAGDGKYNKFLGTTISRSETVNLNPGNNTVSSKKKGWIEKLKQEVMG